MKTLSLQPTRRDFLRITGTAMAAPCFLGHAPAAARPHADGQAARPNIVLVLCDDLGYGDPGCYNPQSKIPTPNIDAMAAQGTRFTDAHCPAAICSPTRYGILTGRNPWRGSWRRGVVKRGEGPLIEKGIPTLPQVLKSARYRTAIVGKWHLGQVDLPPNAGVREFKAGDERAARAAGFDDVLRLWKPDEIPTNRADLFSQQDRLVRERTLAYLQERAQDTERKPFFFYVNPNNPHDPYLTPEKWVGRSDVGNYGDEVMQLDAFLGDITQSLRENGMQRNTLLIFTSDNGPETARRNYSKMPFLIPEDADDRIKLYERRERFGHDSAGGLRGSKYSAYEAGHRVPFIVSWPGTVPAGRVATRLLAQTDLFATCVSTAGAEMPANGAEDSVDQRVPFLGRGEDPVRRHAVFASSKVDQVCMRRGPWTLIGPLPGKSSKRGGYELFNTETDPAQKHDLGGRHPERVKELRDLLAREVQRTARAE